MENVGTTKSYGEEVERDVSPIEAASRELDMMLSELQISLDSHEKNLKPVLLPHDPMGEMPELNKVKDEIEKKLMNSPILDNMNRQRKQLGSIMNRLDSIKRRVQL